MIGRWWWVRRSVLKMATATQTKTPYSSLPTSSASSTTTAAASQSKSHHSSFSGLCPRWVPTSGDHVIETEKHLLSLVKTPFVHEKINIGVGPSGSKARWFHSKSDKPRFINTITFDSKDGCPTLVMLHGYGSSQGFFFRNYDALASHFRVIAIDLLGWGGSSRPDFTCKSTEETEMWFVDSFEEWRKVKSLSNFILLGHSFGGYVSVKYALKHSEHIQQLILVGPAGFSQDADAVMTEWLNQLNGTWKGALANYLFDSNFTFQAVMRILGPWGPDLVRKYTRSRFGTSSPGQPLTEEESKLLADYMYHTLVAKASGELCMKYIFSFPTFTRVPLGESVSEWNVPATFIYGVEDWMKYEGAQAAREDMNVPCEILRVPQGGHFVFLENPTGFNSAVLHACRKILSPESSYNESLPEGLTAV